MNVSFERTIGQNESNVAADLSNSNKIRFCLNFRTVHASLTNKYLLKFFTIIATIMLKFYYEQKLIRYFDYKIN